MPRPIDPHRPVSTWLGALLGILSLVAPLSADDATPTANEPPVSQAFATILEVLKSPRCMNCHPTDDRPRQGDDQHEHLFQVERGTDDHGGAVQSCSTCHRDTNNPYSQIPGAPHWGLAPSSMGWLGLSDAEIRRRLLDPEANGGKDVAALVDHMSHDALVLWAWEPGAGRQPPSVSLDDFRAALAQWLEEETGEGPGRSNPQETRP